MSHRSGKERLDFCLLFVRQFFPADAEKIDAVVGGRIVRGGDDDPERRAPAPRTARETAGVGSTPKDRADQPSAARPEASARSSDSPGSPGVPADQDRRGSFRPRFFSQRPAAAPSRRGERLVDHRPAVRAPHPIGSKIAAVHGWVR